MANPTPKFYQTRLIDENRAEILGFDYSYEVTRNGEFISRARYSNKNLAMRPHKTPDGYMAIGLIKNGKTTTHRVHRIIACAFIPNPENKPYINHIDGIKDNNNPENLEWCTQKENCLHSINVLNKWSSSPKQRSITREIGFQRRKLSMDDAREIRKIYASGEMGCHRLAKKYGISKKGILQIIHYTAYKEEEDYEEF